MVIEYAVLVGLVIAITKIIRTINKPDEKTSVKYFDESFLPLIAVFAGIVLSYLANIPGSEILLNGLIVGLTASGFYDSGKSAVEITKSLFKKE